MSTIVRLAAAMLCVAAPLAAQEPGDHVRIAPVNRPDDAWTPLRLEGTVERVGVDSLVVRDGGRRIALAMRDVYRVDVRTDTRPRGRAALRYAVAGSALGLGAGALGGAMFSPQVDCASAGGVPRFACGTGRGRLVATIGASTLAGAALGALYGYNVAWASWREAPLPGGGRVGFAFLPAGAAVTVAR